MSLLERKEKARDTFANAAYRLIEDELTIVGTWYRCTYIGNDLWGAI